MEIVLQNPLSNAPRPIVFSVLRVPFFLEPHYDDTKPFIESNRDRLLKKWNGPVGWERQKKHHNLKGRGQQAGIPHFNLDRLAANSMASHRLIQHLGKRFGLNVSEHIYDVLNVYYFVEGHSLNDKPRLARVVASALEQFMATSTTTTLPQPPLPPTEASLLDFLNGNEGRAEILAAVDKLQNVMGIHSIPQFIVCGRYMVEGAAHSEEFVQLFRRIEARGDQDEGASPVFASILGLPLEMITRGSHHGVAR
jgi:predicted DsbA family dithiol-disulfide isomerase